REEGARVRGRKSEGLGDLVFRSHPRRQEPMESEGVSTGGRRVPEESEQRGWPDARRQFPKDGREVPVEACVPGLQRDRDGIARRAQGGDVPPGHELVAGAYPAIADDMEAGYEEVVFRGEHFDPPARDVDLSRSVEEAIEGEPFAPDPRRDPVMEIDRTTVVAHQVHSLSAVSIEVGPRFTAFEVARESEADDHLERGVETLRSDEDVEIPEGTQGCVRIGARDPRTLRDHIPDPAFFERTEDLDRRGLDGKRPRRDRLLGVVQAGAG